jgi:CubicO group peptidase (beta-lactamase class C family)
LREHHWLPVEDFVVTRSVHSKAAKKKKKKQYMTTPRISRRSFLATAVAAGAVLPSRARAQKRPDGPFSRSFLDQLPQFMSWANVPGLAVAVVKKRKLEWSGGFGVMKAGEKAPVTRDTLFGAASLSKPVFTLGVLQMKEDKLIDLDRPLWSYLPYEDLPEGDQAKQITARHVLSHSTGLQNWRFQRDQKLEFAFKPGERFQYSGEGFYYLQRVMERITGRGFEEYMQERVLKPLGMVSSTFAWRADAEQKMAWGHNNRMQPLEAFNAERGKRMFQLAAEWNKPVSSWKHEDVVKAHAVIQKDSPPNPNSLLPNTAGSLITSVAEYAQFMLRMLPENSSDKIVTEMLTPQTRVNDAISWGLGIGLEKFGDRSMFWHWGDNGVFKAFMMGERSTGSGIVIFTNGQNGHRLWQRIAAEAMGRDHPAFYFFMT